MTGVLQVIQSSALPTALRESTWGFPILAALHVVMLAWFGAVLLLPGSPRARQWAVGMLIATGAILFALQPVRYASNPVFLLKLALIAAAIAIGQRRWSSVLWIAVICAARAIAYF